MPLFQHHITGRKERAFTALFLCLCLAVSLLAGCGASAPAGDRVYTPAEFRFSGGSGKVVISCPQVEVRAGKTTAKLVFDSPNYSYVKLDEVEYDRVEAESDEESSVFYIPVVCDKEFSVSAMTTAMSTPHEIEYILYVSSAGGGSGEAAAGESAAGKAKKEFMDPKAIPGLTFSEEMPLDYAGCFSVFSYEEGAKLLEVKDSCQYLLLPEGMEAPEGLSRDMVILKLPPKSVYMAATAVMSLIYAMGGEDAVRLSGTDASGWNIEGPGEDMKAGKILYAGKYSAPDYELLLSEGCDLAVESTMILHSPDVQEKLEELGIPVFVDYSSYEMEPLGRMEWIKAYGAILNREKEAEEFFNAQKEIVEEVEKKVSENPPAEKTVAVFAVNTSKTVTIRKGDDYIPRMIEIAGGKYAFADMTDESESGGTATVSMEEFYDKARDADYLIYNATIENPLADIQDLIGKDGLFAEFKAVQEGNVYQIGRDLYQATDIGGLMTRDINIMLSGADESGFTFLEKLK